MINENLITEINATNFKVEKVDNFNGSETPVSVLTFKNKYGGQENHEPCLVSYFNDCEGCNVNTCFDNLVYGDVLVVGLGLGTIPTYIQKFKNYDSIDVVEDDAELTAYVDFLHEDINIITTSDVESYQGSKKYDCVLIENYYHTDQFNSNGTMLHNYTPQLKDQDSVIVCALINKVYSNASNV